MTVRDFALCAHEPEELNVCMMGTSYSLISDYTGKLDPMMLDFLGDYVVADFHSNEAQKYHIWVKEVPVKAVEK